MAELIIQNPSITSGDFSFSGDAITAIAGHPVAGIGGGGTQSDYVYVPSFNDQTGDITFTLGITGSEGKGPWHISGAQGPAGENGKSLSAEYEEDSVNRQTQVKIGQIDGSVQTTFNLPWGINGTSLSAKSSTITGGHRVEIWEKGASQYDDSFDVMDGQDGNDGYSPVVSIDDSVQGQHTITITDKTHQAEPHEFIVYDGTDGDNGDPGYAPIVITKTVTGQGHNNSGTEITITYGEAGAQTAVYTAWNGNDGAGATVTLTGGEGIEVSQAGTNYTIALSATIPTSVTELSDSANYYTVNQTSSYSQLSTEFEKYIQSVLTGTGLTGDGATIALGIDAAAAINFTNASAKSAVSAEYVNIVTTGSVSGNGVNNKPIGLITSAENALTDVANKVTKPDTTQTDLNNNYLIYSTLTGAGTTTGWMPLSANYYSKSEADGRYQKKEDMSSYLTTAQYQTDSAKYVSTGDILTAANNTLTGIKIGNTNYAIPDDYAKQTGNYQNLSAGSATSAYSAYSASYATTAASAYIDSNTTSAMSEIVNELHGKLDSTAAATTYLPLTGGTVSGQLTVSGSNFDNNLHLKRDNNNGFIGLANNGAITIKNVISNSTSQIEFLTSANKTFDITVKDNSTTPQSVGKLYVMSAHSLADATATSANWANDGMLHIILDS